MTTPERLPEVLQIISMDGYNAVCIDTTVFTGATVTVTLLCGNDGANWSTAGTADTGFGAGPTYRMTPHTQFGQIAARYVRVKVSTNATGAIVSLGINCTNIGA